MNNPYAPSTTIASSLQPKTKFWITAAAIAGLHLTITLCHGVLGFHVPFPLLVLWMLPLGWLYVILGYLDVWLGPFGGVTAVVFNVAAMAGNSALWGIGAAYLLDRFKTKKMAR